MKTILTLGTVLLGCCLFAAAQKGSNSGQLSVIPPDNAQITTVQGCLSESGDGDLVLLSDSGGRFQLLGERGKLSAFELTTFVGNEIQVDGFAGAEAYPESMSSNQGDAPAMQINVTRVHKLGNACPSEHRYDDRR